MLATIPVGFYLISQSHAKVGLFVNAVEPDNPIIVKGKAYMPTKLVYRNGECLVNRKGTVGKGSCHAADAEWYQPSTGHVGYAPLISSIHANDVLTATCHGLRVERYTHPHAQLWAFKGA